MHSSNSIYTDGIKLLFEDNTITLYKVENSKASVILKTDIVENNKWNYLAYSYETTSENNNEYQCNMSLYLNGKIVRTSGVSLSKSFISDLKLFLGNEDCEKVKEEDVVYYGNLMVSKNKALSQGEINKAYQEQKHIIFNNIYTTSSIDQDSIRRYENNSELDIYPLHSDLKSLSGNRPVKYEENKVTDNDIDRSFLFCNKGRINAYYACGQELGYSFGFSDRGTILLNAYFNDIEDEKQTLFEIGNYITTGIRLFRYNNNLILYAAGFRVMFVEGIKVNEWNKIGLSFYSETVASGYSEITKHHFRIYLNGEVHEGSSAHTISYSGVTSIGRLNENYISNTLTNETSVDALNGFIEMLCVKNAPLEEDTLKQVITDTLSYTQASNEFDVYSRKNKQEVSVDKNTIISNTYEYKNLEDNRTSNRLSKETITYNETVDRNYETDTLGKTISISDSTFGNHNYEYDYLGRLVKDNDKEYKYDNNGNILYDKDNNQLTYENGLLTKIGTTSID